MVNTLHPVETGEQDETGELKVEQTTKKSVAQILFNPSNPKYKKVEDLPRAFRDDFINTEDETGFVRKDADKYYMEAQRQADKNIRHGETGGLNTMDVLHNSALSEEEILANIIKKGVFGGIKEERKNIIVQNGRTLAPYEVDITNELYERKILTRNFFMELAEAGVNFENPNHTIPLELRNDKEFLLKFAPQTQHLYIRQNFISPQILLEEGNDFLFKFVEAGGDIYTKNREIINTYFANKDHLFVIDYLNKNNTQVNRNTDEIYLTIIEKFKNNRSIKDILEIMLKVYPEMAYSSILDSYELRSIALGILRGMPNGNLVNEIIKYLETKGK